MEVGEREVGRKGGREGEVAGEAPRKNIHRIPHPNPERGGGGRAEGPRTVQAQTKREIFIDNLWVRIHLIIEMIQVDRPCSMRV